MSLVQETFGNSMVCSICTGMVLKRIPVYKINLHGDNVHNGIPVKSIPKWHSEGKGDEYQKFFT